MIVETAEIQRAGFRIPRVLRWVFWAAVGLGMLVGILFLWVAVSTAPPAQAADKFFTAILSDDTTGAYGLASSPFLEGQSQNRFIQELAALKPVQIELEPWEDRVLERNGFSSLNGILRTESGEIVPIVVQMLNEDGEWKVLAMTDHIRMPVGPGLWFKQVPVESEIRRIVKESLLVLNVAVQTDDFGQFSSILPRALRVPSRMSEIGLSFDELVERRVDYSDIIDLEPVFAEPPYLFERRVCSPFGGGCSIIGFELVVTGSYPRDAGQLEFRLMYQYQHPDWVLVCGLERMCTVEIGS